MRMSARNVPPASCWRIPPECQRDAGGTLPWSLKHLHRLIVTSATYRQSSRVAPEMRERIDWNAVDAGITRIRETCDRLDIHAVIGAPPVR